MEEDRLKNYEIKPRPIGKGCYSYVYFAKDTLNQRKVAIKKLFDVGMGKKEALIMKKYGVSPFLPEIYESFTIENKFYIVMEWCSGRRIGHWNFHSKGRKFGRKKATLITINLLKALEKIHNIGFTHCDLLPKNVLIEDDNPNKVKLIDFGLAKPITKSSLYGDLHNAALMCIYLINGVVSRQLVDDLKTIDKPLKEVLYKSFHSDITKRYQSTKEFIEALTPLQEDF
ncbi:protein kinase domain-containing protein [Orenia marismortui]|uniref:Serine/threonine-protein kinase n=1 Tax=Orenia marismortui TaxID=46469 RepID=A0A4V3GYE8_9FIRM|nr:protein kinase [Orenia marismortui]TDX52354.1 serine/threonine-protein kinase [Orenia marismortui]